MDEELSIQTAVTPPNTVKMNLKMWKWRSQKAKRTDEVMNAKTIRTGHTQTNRYERRRARKLPQGTKRKTELRERVKETPGKQRNESSVKSRVPESTSQLISIRGKTSGNDGPKWRQI